MTTAQILNLLYKVSITMDTAIINYLLKTGNAMDFNLLEFLYLIGSFFLKRISHIIFNKTIDL